MVFSLYFDVDSVVFLLNYITILNLYERNSYNYLVIISKQRSFSNICVQNINKHIAAYSNCIFEYLTPGCTSADELNAVMDQVMVKI